MWQEQEHPPYGFSNKSLSIWSYVLCCRLPNIYIDLRFLTSGLSRSNLRSTGSYFITIVYLGATGDHELYSCCVFPIYNASYTYRGACRIVLLAPKCRQFSSMDIMPRTTCRLCNCNVKIILEFPST